MTRTARRRWTRELETEVDGIALGATGPILLHIYDPPAGGRWVDSAIPGKLASLDRNTGEVQWVSPCEVGYGRGFGAGFGGDNDAVVLGPSSNGHRIVRMSLANGELVDVGDVPTFDDAIVGPDVCVCASAKRVTCVETSTLRARWSYAKKGERYHAIERMGERVYVVYSDDKTKKQGVLCLRAEDGKPDGALLAAEQKVIHDIAVDERGVVLFVSDLAAALPREILLDYLMQQEDDSGEAGAALLALDPGARVGDAPLWYEVVQGEESDDGLPELSISADSGKLYVVRGALLEVRDTLTGRPLGDWAVPGLDERVGWSVSQGAGLLAEETRVSVFELPA